LHIAAHLGADNVTSSSDRINKFKKRYIIVCRAAASESKSIDLEIAHD